MPRAWSWYHVVAARPRFGYWNVAKPGPQVAAKVLAALSLKNLYHVPSVA